MKKEWEKDVKKYQNMYEENRIKLRDAEKKISTLTNL